MKTTLLFKITTDAPMDPAQLDDLCREGGRALKRVLGTEDAQTVLGYYYCTGTVRVSQSNEAKSHKQGRRS